MIMKKKYLINLMRETIAEQNRLIEDLENINLELRESKGESKKVITDLNSRIREKDTAIISLNNKVHSLHSKIDFIKMEG
jgi:hypothetical protein